MAQIQVFVYIRATAPCSPVRGHGREEATSRWVSNVSTLTSGTSVHLYLYLTILKMSVLRKKKMKILGFLFFVSMAPGSRQLTCENNLRRPGIIFLMEVPLVLVLLVTRPKE